MAKNYCLLKQIRIILAFALLCLVTASPPAWSESANFLGGGRSGGDSEPSCREPPINQAKELLITDLSVVNSRMATEANGKWTFGFLMSQIAPPGVNPSDFVLDWLNEWSRVDRVNGLPLRPRPEIRRLIDSWPKLSDGRLNLARAPFRLLAIVNRVDLNSALTPQGEGRFVFGLIDSSGSPLRGTVIFEYTLPLIPGDLNHFVAWTKRWHEISSLSFGTTFNQNLERITDLFTLRGTGPAGGTAISHIRTNENFLRDPWELREFELDLASGRLRQTTTKQTPAMIFNTLERDGGRLSELLNFMRTHKREILEEGQGLPDSMLGGAAESPTIWAADLNREGEEMQRVRTAVASVTCNGCHSAETKTEFLHIAPRFAQSSAQISDFLRGELAVRARTAASLLAPSDCARRGALERSPIPSPH